MRQVVKQDVLLGRAEGEAERPSHKAVVVAHVKCDSRILK